jgi:hypothetical protein
MSMDQLTFSDHPKSLSQKYYYLLPNGLISQVDSFKNANKMQGIYDVGI